MLTKISSLTQVRPQQAEAVLRLFDEGCTVPFIARYRKEVTGELDEVQIISIRDAYENYTILESRKEAILKSLSERELLTAELGKRVKEADTLVLLEDIYLPYKPKRRTRGMIAKEAGLEPFSAWLLLHGTGAGLENPLEIQRVSGKMTQLVLRDEAGKYLNEEKGIKTTEDALSGARDIIAERLNETERFRQELRDLFEKKALLSSRVLKSKEEDPAAAKYRDYFEWDELANRAPSHRILAIMRGGDEGFLIDHFLPPEDEALGIIRYLVIGRNNPEQDAAAEQVWIAAQEAYRRLTAPSLENAYRKECKERADEEAILVFADNIRELLLASPLGRKSVLAIDPGLRTGCKIVCLDAKGDLKHHDVIYPLVPRNQIVESTHIIKQLCKKFEIEAIAVGNGTGGREAEDFARNAVSGISSTKGKPIQVVMVNESGASVYSASTVAREEFPDQDVTVRGAVSIGRRLMDPLAELVKIDPRSIGVGQYQHDVDQKKLKKSLDDVTLSCVNSVGVEINSASKQLLSYVSGITPRIAAGICSYREMRGMIKSREELKNVSGLGPKAFEQAAGFLRIREGINPLDASAVHPESYPVVEKMAKDLSCTVSDLIKDAKLRRSIDLKKYVTETIGLPTLKDIMAELEKPGRDPRAEFEAFSFSDTVHELGDLEAGMILPGIVTNVTAFGAFVDIGVHQDGLVHISQLSDSFVRDPSAVVKVHQKVTVRVLEVDIPRKRISLSMKSQ